MNAIKDEMPHWPRGLSRAQASRYVGVSYGTFDRMVADGQMPKPKRTYGRTIWDKRAVDAAFDILDGGTERDEWGEEIVKWSNDADVPKGGTTNEHPPYQTLSEEEAIIWSVAYREQWKQGVLAREMSRSERKVLSLLSSTRGRPTLLSQFPKGLRRSPVEKLVWRGYAVQVEHGRGKETFEITDLGFAAIETC